MFDKGNVIPTSVAIVVTCTLSAFLLNVHCTLVQGARSQLATQSPTPVTIVDVTLQSSN